MMAGYLPSGSGHKPPNLNEELAAVGWWLEFLLLNGQHMMGPTTDRKSKVLSSLYTKASSSYVSVYLHHELQVKQWKQFVVLLRLLSE